MDVRPLHREEFGEFFTAIHGYGPFPWQRLLADQVFAKKQWPEALDVPTGAGKTAAIDIAVFHLALEADLGSMRRAAVRVLFVVDRRLVVDDAFDRARRIADALCNPGKDLSGKQKDLLRRVGDRLRLLAGLGGEGPPLAVARLRGGLPKEPDWVRTPSQPVVVVSTVDQVGSRLLFRGYGISDSMKPVHAGLLGRDALLLLDEAHLSRPFVETVRDLRRLEAPLERGGGDVRPLSVVTLSATHLRTRTESWVFEFPQERDQEDWVHPVLGGRLNAAKPAELVKVGEDAEDAAFVEAFVARAWTASQAGGGPARVVAVVVNRVQRARAIHAALDQKLRAGQAEGRTALLIGRCRDVDREKLLGRLLPDMAAQRAETGGPPLLIVATQCVEAGADLDFDALFTEIAPLDCLRQRFGRLNRMGRKFQALAAVLAAKSQIGARADDPLYGPALGKTWELLEEKSQTVGKGKTARRLIDFGIAAAQDWLPRKDELAPYLAPAGSAPVLLPAYIDLWSQTSPVPAVSPEVALFLHGPQAGPEDVEIIWRADLDRDRPDKEMWIERVRVCPPSALEALSLPFGVAKRWLCGGAGEVSDVEGREIRAEGTVPGQDYRALRWRGPEDPQTDLIYPRQIRPGDVLVVPSSYGGCDEFGWAPHMSMSAPVADVGEPAYRQQRGRSLLRLTLLAPLGGLLESLRNASKEEVFEKLSVHEALPGEWRERLIKWRERLHEDGDLELLRDAQDRPLAIVGEREADVAAEASTEDDEGMRRRGLRVVRLDEHSRGVEEQARRFARGAGLSPALTEAVALAAFLHDAGKAHPQFKMWLYGGDELAAMGPALAKSGKAVLGRQAYERAGLPRGARHEAASVRFAVAHPRFQSLEDKELAELVIWLIGTHHGWGRPFFPAVEWPAGNKPFEADLGDGKFTSKQRPQIEDPGEGWPDLFWRLKQRHGTWGLAWLEAILRLADHRRSEEEQRRRKTDKERRKEGNDVAGAG